MATQQITIELPELVLRQLTSIAEATHQPIEMLVRQSVLNNLPPSPDNAPPELQQELLTMQTLSSDQIQSIAQSQVEPLQFDRHTTLLEKNTESSLTLEECRELSNLRQSADHLTLRKAYAWSILRWRGKRIPNLNEFPI